MFEHHQEGAVFNNLRCWFVSAAQMSERQTAAALKMCEDQFIESVDDLKALCLKRALERATQAQECQDESMRDFHSFVSEVAKRPSVKLLLTSRTALGVPGEDSFALDQLSADAATNLLCDLSPGTSTEEAKSFVRVLGGHPLAICLLAPLLTTIVAGDAGNRGAAMLALRKDVLDKLETLKTPTCPNPSKHHSLRVSIALSVKWLRGMHGDDAVQLFERFGLLRFGAIACKEFEYNDFEAPFFSSFRQPREQLKCLQQYALVQCKNLGEGVWSYSMLPSVATFAREALTKSNSAESVHELERMRRQYFEETVVPKLVQWYSDEEFYEEAALRAAALDTLSDALETSIRKYASIELAHIRPSEEEKEKEEQEKEDEDEDEEDDSYEALYASILSLTSDEVNEQRNERAGYLFTCIQESIEEGDLEAASSLLEALDKLEHRSGCRFCRLGLSSLRIQAAFPSKEVTLPQQLEDMRHLCEQTIESACSSVSCLVGHSEEEHIKFAAEARRREAWYHDAVDEQKILFAQHQESSEDKQSLEIVTSSDLQQHSHRPEHSTAKIERSAVARIFEIDGIHLKYLLPFLRTSGADNASSLPLVEKALLQIGRRYFEWYLLTERQRDWFRNSCGENGSELVINSLDGCSRVQLAQTMGVCVNSHQTLTKATFRGVTIETGITALDLSGKGLVLKELDLSSKDYPCNVEFIQTFSVGLCANGALTLLNISDNKIGGLVGWKYENCPNPDFWYEHSDGRHQKERPAEEIGQKPLGAIALAEAIKINRALVKFDISSNTLCAEGGKAIAEALKNNQVMTELNIASNYLGEDLYDKPDMSGVVAISNAIPTMGALAKLIFGGDGTYWDEDQQKNVSYEPATLEIGMKEADLSNKNLGVGGAIIAGAWISHKDNGALTSLNLSENYIHAEGAEHVAEAIKGHLDLTSGSTAVVYGYSCYITTKEALVKFDISANKLNAAGSTVLAKALKGSPAMTELNLSSNNLGGGYCSTDMSGVVAIADAIPTMGALMSLNIKDNSIGDEGKTALGHALLQSNVQFMICDKWSITQETTALDVSSKGLTAADAVLLAGVISANGALAKLTFGGDSYEVKDGYDFLYGETKYKTVTPEAAVLEVGMSEANLSHKNLGVGGAIIVEAWISHKDNRALASVNILSNRIGAEQANALIKIMESKSNLTTLCGFSGDETELDLSKKGLTAGCAVLVANEIKNNGALQKLVMADNRLATKEAGKALADALATNSVLKELDLSKNAWEYYRYDDVHADGPGFAKELAVGLSTNGALKRLDIGNNQLCAHWKTPNFSGYQALVAAIEDHKLLTMDTVNMAEELDVSGQNLRVEGAKTMAVFIKNNGALSFLNIKDNAIGDEGKTFLGNALPESDVQFMICDEWSISQKTTELNVSSKGLKPVDALLLGGVIRNNRALAKLTFGGDRYSNSLTNWKAVTPEPAILEVGMTEADLSNKNLGSGGATIVGAWIAHKGTGTLSYETITKESLVAFLQKHEPKTVAEVDNLLSHFTTTELLEFAQESFGEAPEVTVIPKAKGAMKTVTINTFALPIQDIKTQSDLDFSDKCLCVEDAIIIAALIPLNGALEKLVMADNRLATKEAGKALADALATNSVLKELDLSKNAWEYYRYDDVHADGPGFAKELAVGLSTNGALVSANLLNNDIGIEQARNLATVLKEHATLKSLCGNKGDEEELKMSGKGMGADGAIMLAPEIVANGALEKLLMGANGFKGAEAGKALGDAIATNTVLKELDISGGLLTSQQCDVEFVKEFSVGLGANGALTSLNLASNCLEAEGARHFAEAIKGHVSVLRFDWHHFELDLTSGSTAVVYGYCYYNTKKGAMTNLHIGNNGIPTKNMNEIIALVGAKPAMKVLCAVPFRDETITELDVSGQSLGVEGAIVISRFLENNGALTSLDISSNNIGHLTLPPRWSGPDSDGDYKSPSGGYQKAPPPGSKSEGAIALADAIKNNGALTSLNISDNKLTRGKAKYSNSDPNEDSHWETDMSGTQRPCAKRPTDNVFVGVIALADGIKNNGALTSLNISSNNISGWRDSVYVPADSKVGDAFGEEVIVHKYPNPKMAQVANFSGVEALADGIKNNGALTSIHISNNHIPHAQEAVVYEAVRLNKEAVGQSF
eukprot:g641.t1